MKEEDIGFYNAYQLCSAKETTRQKAHNGIFQWGKTKLLALVGSGEFPAPIKIGNYNVWAKGVIHEYARLIAKGVELADATIQAQAAVV